MEHAAVMFPLRCDRCKHFLEEATEIWKLMATFSASLPLLFPKTHPREKRHKCRHCGYVNVFHPLTLDDAIASL